MFDFVDKLHFNHTFPPPNIYDILIYLQLVCNYISILN
jgi:hypothetical protein